MTKRAAIHTILLTIGALHLLLILGAPFCILSRSDHHGGHKTDQSPSACSWAFNLCDSTLLSSREYGTISLHPTSLLFIVAGAAASEFEFQVHPARSPPVFLS